MIRMRDIPRELWIAGNHWTVHFFRKPPLQEKLDEEILGACVPKTRRIYIKQGQTPKEAFSTLVHEYIHALEHEYGLSFDHAHIEAIEMPLTELFLALRMKERE